MVRHSLVLLGLLVAGPAGAQDVAVVSANSARLLELLYAVPGSGRGLVPVNFRLQPSSLRVSRGAWPWIFMLWRRSAVRTVQRASGSTSLRQCPVLLRASGLMAVPTVLPESTKMDILTRLMEPSANRG